MNELILILSLFIPPGPVIALTFDDGLGTIYNHRVIRTLDKHNARATFFPKGRSLFHPSTNLKRVAREIKNHELGTHGWAQGDPRHWSSSRTCKEFYDPIYMINKKFSRTVMFYRPPSGIRLSKFQRQVLGTGCMFSRKYPIPFEITWTYTTGDIVCKNRGKSRAHCFRLVRRRLKWLLHGRHDHVVLMHDNLPDTPAHVKWIMENKTDQAFVTLSRYIVIQCLKIVRQCIKNYVTRIM